PGDLLDDLLHRGDEPIQAGLGLGLGRLDHERLRNDQREIDRRWVEAEIDQSFRDVLRRHALRLRLLRRQHELVQGWPTEGVIEIPAQVMPEVAGVEHGVLRYFVDGVAVSADVGVGAKQHAEVAVERPHLANRLRSVVLEAKSFVRALNRGNRQEGHEMRFNTDRAGPRAAAAMRRGEGFVQVEVNDIEAHIAGPGDANQGVEVGAVVIELYAVLVRQPGDLQDVLLEDTGGIRVRQ